MTLSASPAIQLSADNVTWGAPGAPLQVSAGATVYARLNSTANVDSTTWAVTSTDDLGSAPALTPSGIVNSLVTCTAGAAGTCFILQSTINSGVDKTTGNTNPLTTQATVIVEVLAANGLGVCAFDEHAEHGSQWWLPKINAAIRGANGSSGAFASNTLVFPSTAPSPSVTQAQLAGTGASGGATLSIQAQQGQAQTGVAANNDGGALSLSGGSPGTGGSGGGAARGAVDIDGGDVSVIANWPVLGGASGTVFVSAPTIQLQARGAISHIRFQADSTGIGFYGVATVAQASRVGQLTDSTTGTPSTTIGDVGGAFSQSTLNNIHASLLAKINALELALHNLGLTA